MLYRENKDDCNISDGVLTGAPHFHVLTAEEKKAVVDLVQHNVEAVETFRSVFLPLHCIPNGKLYREGDIIIAIYNGSEVIAKVNNFFLLNNEDNWTSLALLNLFEPILNDDGTISRHPISDTIIVSVTPRNICLPVKQILRQIMLYPDNDHGFAVVDSAREIAPLPQVVVPLYPESGDFINVQGDSGEMWRANIVSVNLRQKNCSCIFLC